MKSKLIRVLETLLRVFGGGDRHVGEIAHVSVQEQRVFLEKFDGDAPRPGELKEPAEIVEVTPGKPHEVLYRKGEGAKQLLYTGIESDTGLSAVLAKKVNRPEENQ